MRAWFTWLCWGWWSLAMLALALRWFDLTGPVPAAQSLLPVAGLALLPLIVLTAVARRWIVCFCAGVLLIPYAVLALPWWVPGGGEPAEGDVVVMAANLQFGGADLAEVQDAVRDQGVDVLVLVEITPDFLEQIEQQDAFAELPHRSGAPRTDAGGTMVLTAMPHQEVAGPVGIAFDQVAVEVGVGERTWTVLGTHTAPPLGTNSDRWRADLRRLETWVGAHQEGGPVVVAGDLNSSQAHPAFRSATEGLESAHRAAGAGWVRTWPTDGWLPRFVQLDHVLVRDLTVVDAGEQELPGSDHRMVWARLGGSSLG